jgi:POT family proton-dependent oligopeptide transporter
MAIATFIFWVGTKHYVRVPPSRETKNAGFFRVFWEAVTGQRKPGDKFWGPAQRRFSVAEVDAAKSVLPILLVFAFVPPFWTLFDQTNSTWVLQGEKMKAFDLLGLHVGAEQMQSANPLLVMLLVPVLTLGLYPLMGRLASPLRRMSYGMFVAAFSYVIVAWLQRRIEAGQEISVAWQMLPYAVLTIAEVLVSTTGLEFAFREAAPEMKSLIMSFWLLTTTLGDMLVVFITEFFSDGSGSESVTSGRFMQYAEMLGVVAVVFSIVTCFYRYRDRTAAEGK